MLDTLAIENLQRAKALTQDANGLLPNIDWLSGSPRYLLAAKSKGAFDHMIRTSAPA